MDKQEFLQLAKRISTGVATDAEIARYNQWCNATGGAGQWNTDELGDPAEKEAYLFQNIQSNIQHSERRKVRRMHKLFISAAAAVILGILGVSMYFYFATHSITVPQATVEAINVSPGSNKAILTLANGKRISLTDARNGQLAQRLGVKVIKTADGQLVYTIEKENATALPPGKAEEMNTIETPRGGQYQVRLPDGTKVWLNAASSLKYPVSFASLRERRVELTGEAYFEVAHNKALPFQVTSRGQTVEVLGTHFNINSYADERNIVTTLEQGSVKVTVNNQSRTILPGQQTIIAANNIQVRQADIETALGWKNGVLKFTDADVQSIMRQISRWYDVDIQYSGKLPDRLISGGIYRNAKLSTLLKTLEQNGIHFSVNENAAGIKTLIVSP